MCWKRSTREIFLTEIKFTVFLELSYATVILGNSTQLSVQFSKTTAVGNAVVSGL